MVYIFWIGWKAEPAKVTDGHPHEQTQMGTVYTLPQPAPPATTLNSELLLLFYFIAPVLRDPGRLGILQTHYTATVSFLPHKAHYPGYDNKHHAIGGE